MSPYPSPNHHRAIAWALLSQAIWLPLVAIDAHDQWQARVKALTPPTDPAGASEPKPAPVPPTRLAATLPLPSLEDEALGTLQGPPLRPSRGAANTGVLLGPSPSRPSFSLPSPSPWIGNLQRAVGTPLQAVISLARPSRWIPSAPLAPTERPVTSSAPSRWQGPPIPTPTGGDLLLKSFTRSELLGGTLGLQDIDEAPMSAVALAERARWSGSADPMAPLPALWRDPMRRALGQIPGGAARIEQARVVHLPSLRVTRTTEVPLALQSDGSVDILSKPDNPGVVREIADWSSRQQAPSRGGVLPAVVLLHPVNDVPLIAPAEAIPIPIRSESQAVGQPSSTSKDLKALPRQARPTSWDQVAPSAPTVPTAELQSVTPAVPAIEVEAPQAAVAEAAAPEPVAAPERPAAAADPLPAPAPASATLTAP